MASILCRIGKENAADIAVSKYLCEQRRKKKPVPRKKNALSKKQRSKLREVAGKISIKLIKSATPWEILLKNHLDYLGILYKFQAPFVSGKNIFVLDFLIDCEGCGLCVELDGIQHRASYRRDARRTRIIERKNIRVIRFWNSEITNDPDHVLGVILSYSPKRIAGAP